MYKFCIQFCFILQFFSNHIFDVANNSPKNLRHYKFTIVRFLVALLSNADFINRVAELVDDEVDELKPLYDTLIVEVVIFIQNTSKNADLHQGKPNGKYWKVMLHNLYDILDLVNNLLPNQIFIASVTRLIDHESLTVRRKTLELLNTRLAQKKFADDDHEDLLALIDPVTSVLSGPHKFVNPEVEVIHQTALITLKLLAKLLAYKRPDVFKPVSCNIFSKLKCYVIELLQEVKRNLQSLLRLYNNLFNLYLQILDLTTELIKKREGAVLGSAALCVAELCSSMRIHAIQSLNKFVPAIIKLLDKYCHSETPDILTISIVSALQKIVESFGNFLSLYLDQLLYELARLNFLYTDSEHPKVNYSYNFNLVYDNFSISLFFFVIYFVKRGETLCKRIHFDNSWIHIGRKVCITI